MSKILNVIENSNLKTVNYLKWKLYGGDYERGILLDP